MDIVEFLPARLDEDEAAAQFVEDNSAPFTGEWVNDDGRALRTRNGWTLAYMPDAKPWRPGVLDHIARHDPARVLAEVAAKRAIVAQHAGTHECPSPNDWALGKNTDYVTEEECWTLRNLAAPYADHPDYNPAWRVG